MCALADDLRREHEILKNLLADVCQSPAVQPLLFDARIACWLAEDSVLGHKNNVTVGKLLLQLASKPKIVAKKEMVPARVQHRLPCQFRGWAAKGRRDVTSPEPCGRPSAAERAQTQRSPSFPAHVHFACSRDLKGAQLCLEVRHAVLVIKQCLCNSRLGFIGWGSWRVRRTENFVL